MRRFRGGPAVSADLSFPGDGAVTVLLDPSGSRKTTVLRALAGLERPDEGTISLDGETWFDVARILSVPARLRRVSLLFQDDALLPHLTARESVASGLHRLAAAERTARTFGPLTLLRLDSSPTRGRMSAPAASGSGSLPRGRLRPLRGSSCRQSTGASRGASGSSSAPSRSASRGA